MNESEYINSMQDKPFSLFAQLMDKLGYKRQSLTRQDRTRNLRQVTYIVHDRNRHKKVVIWHSWQSPDAYGVSQPAYVTDIDVTNLELSEATQCTG